MRFAAPQTKRGVRYVYYHERSDPATAIHRYRMTAKGEVPSKSLGRFDVNRVGYMSAWRPGRAMGTPVPTSSRAYGATRLVRTGYFMEPTRSSVIRYKNAAGGIKHRGTQLTPAQTTRFWQARHGGVPYRHEP